MSESNLAPENRCKRLPRGKPFAKGEHGNPNSEFKPGQSGNPGGRPQSAPLTEALRRVLSMRVKDIGLKPTDKVSLAMAKRWAYEGLNGDVRATVAMVNRVEGPPAQTLQHQGLESIYQVPPGEPRQREIAGRMVQILLERSRIYGLPAPEVVQEAERQIEDERQARRDGKAKRNGPPRTSSSEDGQ